MTIEEQFEDMEFEKKYSEEEKKTAQGITIAEGFGWGFSKFKRFVSQFLKRDNDEDQWVHDYESWVYWLKPGRYEHPVTWAREFYGEDWDREKEKKSMESIKEIAMKSKPA